MNSVRIQCHKNNCASHSVFFVMHKAELCEKQFLSIHRFIICCAFVLCAFMLISSCAMRKKPAVIKEKPLVQEKSAPPEIGIAWRYTRPGTSSWDESVTAAVEAYGGTPVQLGEVFFDKFDYDTQGKLPESYLTEYGSLRPEFAQLLLADPGSSNASDVIGDVKTVIFTGGSDFSPSLFRLPESVTSTVGSYDATRDVSEYLLMHYCLEHDIGVVGICRGMQLLGIVSGCSYIQDIGDFYTHQGLVYNGSHLSDIQGVYQRHDVVICSSDSIAFEIFGVGLIKDVASSHHQAVGSVANTHLTVTGIYTDGELVLPEIAERKDKSFAIGVQFHPEAYFTNKLKLPSDEPMAAAFFGAIVEHAKSVG